MKRILEFDGLRAVAVLAVIADHYAPFRTMGNGASATLGTFGVDLFFVLSGYLITTILLQLRGEPTPYRVFYVRRFLRILPPFVLVLTLVYGAGTLLPDPLNKWKFVGQLLFLRSFKDTAAVLHQLWAVMSGRAAIPALFAKLPRAPISRDYGHIPITGSLGPTGTLSVEEWFYVLWAPVVLLCRRRIILVIAFAMCLTGFTLRWLTGNQVNFFACVDVLISGALLALWLEHRPSISFVRRLRMDQLFVWMALLSFCLFVALTLMHRDRIACSLIEVAAAGGLGWIVLHKDEGQRVMGALRSRPLIYLGTISYMIYLIHLPMYFAVRATFSHVLGNVPDEVSFWAVALLSIAGTFVFAALSWHYFETPLLGLKDRLTDGIRDSSSMLEFISQLLYGKDRSVTS